MVLARSRVKFNKLQVKGPVRRSVLFAGASTFYIELGAKFPKLEDTGQT